MSGGGKRGVTLEMGRFFPVADAGPPATLPCPDCTREFVGIRALAIHRARLHGVRSTRLRKDFRYYPNLPTRRCPVCGVVFKPTHPRRKACGVICGRMLMQRAAEAKRATMEERKLPRDPTAPWCTRCHSVPEFTTDTDGRTVQACKCGPRYIRTYVGTVA
jgi:hypothetical protein